MRGKEEERVRERCWERRDGREGKGGRELMINRSDRERETKQGRKRGATTVGPRLKKRGEKENKKKIG